MTETKNYYRKGRIAEKKVCNDLESKGFKNIQRSKGSRGPADIYARKGDQKYYIQVKSGTAKISSDELEKLKVLAKDRKGTAVVIHRDNGKNQWSFHGNWRKKKK